MFQLEKFNFYAIDIDVMGREKLFALPDVTKVNAEILSTVHLMPYNTFSSVTNAGNKISFDYLSTRKDRQVRN